MSKSTVIGSIATVGEVNTASNLGGGAGTVYSTKFGSDLRFKSLVPGGSVSMTQDADEITINSVPLYRTVIVDASAAPIANKVFNTWAAADAYVATQAPGKFTHWKIKLFGDIAEAIVGQNYTILEGEGSTYMTTLSGSVSGSGSSSFFIKNCYITGSINLSNSSVQLYNCDVVGTINLDSTLGNVLLYFFQHTYFASGTINYTVGAWGIQIFAYDSTIRSAANFRDFTANNCRLGNMTYTLDAQSDYLLQNCIIGNSTTFTIPAVPIQFKTISCNGPIIVNGAEASSWVNEGDLYDNATSGLVADNVQAAIDEIAGAGGGETNTASNRVVGDGNIFYQKTGVDLELRALTAGTNVTISEDTDAITINAAGGSSDLKDVYLEHRLVGTNDNLRSDLVEVVGELTIHTPGGGSGGAFFNARAFGNGQFMIAYSDNDALDGEFVVINTDGTQDGATTTFYTGAGFVTSSGIKLATLKNGDIVIASSLWDGGSHIGEFWVHSADKAQQSTGTFSANTMQAVAVSALDTGGFVVVYVYGNNKYFRIYDDAGAPVTVETLFNAGSIGNAYNLHVCLLTNGNFAITWMNGGDTNLNLAIYNSAGTQVMAPTVIRAAYSLVYDMISLKSGNLCILYHDSADFCTALVDIDGNVIEEHLNAGSLNGWDLTLLPNGDILVAAEDEYRVMDQALNVIAGPYSHGGPGGGQAQPYRYMTTNEFGNVLVFYPSAASPRSGYCRMMGYTGLLSNGPIQILDEVPTVTTNKLYNNAGALTWDGAAVGGGADGFETRDGGIGVIGWDANKGTIGANSVDGSVADSGSGMGPTGGSSTCFGLRNTVSGEQSAAMAGYDNIAGSDNAFLGGGIDNTITAGGYSCCSIVGGRDNVLNSSHYQFIGGGRSNSVTGQYSGIMGGYTNSIPSSQYSSIVGGQNNTINDGPGFIGGGESNTVDGGYAYITGGSYGVAKHVGSSAHAAGRFSANGDAQLHRVPMMSRTTDGGTYVMGPRHSAPNANATNLIVINANQTVRFEANIVAKEQGSTNSNSYKITGLIVRDGSNNTTLKWFSPVTEYEDIVGCSVDAAADDTNEALQIRVTGVAATDIRWVCRLQTEEVIYA